MLAQHVHVMAGPSCLWLQIYQRTCPVRNNVCQPAGSIVNTGTVNAQNITTTTVVTDPSAPIYFMVGNAGVLPKTALICPLQVFVTIIGTCRTRMG